jgi:hypothetical protein
MIIPRLQIEKESAAAFRQAIRASRVPSTVAKAKRGLALCEIEIAKLKAVK